MLAGSSRSPAWNQRTLRRFGPCYNSETEPALRFAPCVAILAFALIAAPVAQADTPLPPEQKAKVEAMLRQEGFTKWSEIELDDGMIEVDDAIDSAGKKVDLKLDPNTLAIVKRKND